VCSNGRRDGARVEEEVTVGNSYRRQPRAPFDAYLNKVVGNSVFMCRAKDISEEGIYFSRLIEPAGEGDTVHLEFALPGHDEVVWACGRVVRDGSHRSCEGTGIRFTVLPARFREMIAGYVRLHEQPV
jgi:hypothetical protein